MPTAYKGRDFVFEVYNAASPTAVLQYTVKDSKGVSVPGQERVLVLAAATLQQAQTWIDDISGNSVRALSASCLRSLGTHRCAQVNKPKCASFFCVSVDLFCAQSPARRLIPIVAQELTESRRAASRKSKKFE